jgi:hypothetical protein
MPSLSEAQRTWVDRFLGKSSSQPVESAVPDGRVASGPKPRGTLVDIDDLEGNPNVQRDNPNLKLPTRHQMVKVIDLDQGKEYEATADQVKEIKKSPDYIDNFKELRAQPDWMELTIDRIEFIYSSGKKYFVEMDSVNHNLNHSAQYFGRKGGIYYPRDANGNTLIDAMNTPKVVGGKEWIDKEIARRKDEREKIAWIVYTFAGAVASLGGTAGGGKGGGRVSPPAGGGRPLPRTGGTPTGGRPTSGGTGGGRAKPTGGTGGGKPPTGAPAKPTGGTGGAPTSGGAPTTGGSFKGGGKPKGGAGTTSKPTGGDGDPGKATGKKRDPIKPDKTNAGEGKASKTTSGSKDSKKNGGKGDSDKSTGKEKPSGGGDDGKGKPNTGSGGKPVTGSGTKTETPARPPLMSADELNQPVPQAKRAKGHGPPRKLEPDERKNANIVLNALEEMRAGNQAPFNQLGPLRPHLNTKGEFSGWYGVDLRPGNPGALNQMRIYFQPGKGTFRVMLRQGH